MKYDDLITFFQSLVDDEPDEAMLEVLADNAYTKRNASRFWTFLLKLDTSMTHGASDTWQTNHTLPTDFDEPYKVFGGAAGQNEYDAVPYQNILNMIGNQNRYSIDYLNSQLRVPGPGNGQTIYFFYKYLPTSLIGLSDALKAATTTIVWPKQFVPLIGYDMAELYFGGIDADDISRQMAPSLAKAKLELERAMISWDTKRLMKMFGNSASPQRMGNELTPSDVIDIPT